MTPEMAKKWLPIIQAVAEGKTLQALQRSGEDKSGPSHWEDCDMESVITWCPDFLRIKPEPRKPREFWIVQRCGSPVFQTIPRIAPFADKPPIVADGESIIHVREVIDE